MAPSPNGSQTMHINTGRLVLKKLCFFCIGAFFVYEVWCIVYAFRALVLPRSNHPSLAQTP